MNEIFFSSLMENYLSLGGEGKIKSVAGGNEFWSLPSDKLDEFGEKWLITEFQFDEDWKTWEMHPHGEEIVYLLSGSLDLILEKDENLQTIELRGKGLVIIPRFTWHTAKVFAPSSVLIITHGKDTQVKSVE